jgi:hypothetical protein
VLTPLALLALGAAASAAPLLVSTRYLLVYVDGNTRQTASAGPGTSAYRILGATSDGTVLVTFDDGGMADVEAISPQLQSRTVKRFPRQSGAFVSATNDGFVAYDPAMQLMRRYDLAGNAVGSPIAPSGAVEALGIGNAIVVTGNGRLAVWDSGGHLRQEQILDGHSLVALGADRFAVIDAADRQVRVYDTSLNRKATLPFPVREPRALAAGPDGSLGILTGIPSCVGSGVEVDVYDDPTASQPRAQIRQNVGTARAIAVGADEIYVANGGCRGDDDGSIAIFGRDGSQHAVLGNVASPTSLIVLPAASR